MIVSETLALAKLRRMGFNELLVSRLQRVIRMHKSRVLVLTDVLPEGWDRVMVEAWRCDDESVELRVTRYGE